MTLLCLRMLEQLSTRSLQLGVGFTHHLKLPGESFFLGLLLLLTDKLPGTLNGLVTGHVLGRETDWGARRGVEEDLLDEIVSGFAVERVSAALFGD